MTYLITPTLLNSWQYYFQYEGEKEDEVRKDFLRTLSREKFEPNEAMQKGIEFEEDIQFACKHGIESENSELVEYCKVVDGVADVVRNGIWQSKLSKELMIGDQNFLLYGRSDVIKADTIFDIKFTTNGSNYEPGKYINSAQHRIYLYCSDMPKFSYLISDGKDFWQEDYKNHSGIEDELKSMISEFLDYLEGDLEAKELFNCKWKSYDNSI